MARRKPSVGITTSLVEGEQRLKLEYVLAVAEAGAVPFLVPQLDDAEIARAVVKKLDALIIIGGPAVDIGVIGELPADLAKCDPQRIRADLIFLSEAIRASRPILGICYGMQLMNAFDGGTIYADVERDVPGTLTHSVTRGASDHLIEISEGSRLAEVLGTTRMQVNSRHVQALASVGPSYEVVARAPDGVVEAIESKSGRMIGVQFHPEQMREMSPLFRYFAAQSSNDFGNTGT